MQKIPNSESDVLWNISGLYHWYFWKPYGFRCPFFRGEWKWEALEYKRSLADSLQIENKNLIFLNQTHSSEVAIINNENQAKEVYADAALTQISGLGLWVLTSDCLPIFLYDPVQKIAWVMHAGWKWLEANIISKTIEKSIKNYCSEVKNMRIYVGPSICHNCYEVWEEFLEKFPNYVIEKSGKYFLDLKKIAKSEILKNGVKSENIEISDECTYCKKEKFHSYRRYTHKAEEWYANNAGIIMFY